MADLGKNGYQWTGYTEPFILTDTILQGEPLSKVGGWGIITIDGGVPIENTEYKNSGLWVSVNTIDSSNVFTSKQINFDAKISSGRFIITDGVSQSAVSGVVYNNVTQEYTVTTETPLTLIEGRSYTVIGRVVDVSDIIASKDYEVGDVIYEIFPHQGGGAPVIPPSGIGSYVIGSTFKIS